MAKKFRDLVAQMPQERQARIAAETQRLIDEMPLQALRRALDLARQQVAASLGINRVAVSKMEGQTDLYVSALRRFVEAMGGEPRIVAHFPEGDVVINQCSGSRNRNRPNRRRRGVRPAGLSTAPARPAGNKFSPR